MTGIFVIFGSKKQEDDSVQRAINILTHEEHHRIDKFRDELFTGVRIHLGIFNPEEQPLWNKERSVCIFFDGKLYGHEESLKELKRAGDNVDGDNDAAFCLSSYLTYGTDFIKELDGSFICVIYDTIQKKLTLFNDRFGYRVHFFRGWKEVSSFHPRQKEFSKSPGSKRNYIRMLLQSGSHLGNF